MNTSRAARRRIIGSVAATAVGLATLALMSAPASAAPARPAGTIDGGFSLISSNSGGANLRASATMNSTRLEYLPNGTEVGMICWTTGQTVSPPNSNYTSDRWFKVEPEYDFTVGYVHSSLVIDQANVRQC